MLWGCSFSRYLSSSPFRSASFPSKFLPVRRRHPMLTPWTKHHNTPADAWLAVLRRLHPTQVPRRGQVRAPGTCGRDARDAECFLLGIPLGTVTHVTSSPGVGLRHRANAVSPSRRTRTRTRAPTTSLDRVRLFPPSLPPGV